MGRVRHGLRFWGTQFWVIHRGREFGPFDYEWSSDFHGIELLYRGQKFGEVCSEEEFFADLKPLRLPMRAAQVACVVLGSMVLGIVRGLSPAEKHALLVENLRRHGLEKFAANIQRLPLRDAG